MTLHLTLATRIECHEMKTMPGIECQALAKLKSPILGTISCTSAITKVRQQRHFFPAQSSDVTNRAILRYVISQVPSIIGTHPSFTYYHVLCCSNDLITIAPSISGIRNRPGRSSAVSIFMIHNRQR